jgi:outer membrane receptor protein involved in Fe transport
LNGAFRYVDNSLTGGDPTYTLGGSWQPVADLTIRGNYTRSIRAPAVTELFNPSSSIFTLANDSCDPRFIADGPAPAVRAANCASQNFPANFTSEIVNSSKQGSLVGNPNLRNEKANSYTIGAILRPSFIPRLTISVDWVSIKLRDATLALDANQVFAACYDSADFPNAYCGRIDRAPNGQVTFVRTGYANAASFDYQGIMAAVAYRAPTPFLGANSAIDFDLNYQYIDKLEQRVGVGDRTTLRGDAGYSRHKATANIGYTNGGFGWAWQAQYYGKAQVDPDAAADTYSVSTVDDIVYVNSAVSYAVNDRFTMRFIVDNVFDAGVPYPVPAGGGTVAYWDGILGRAFKIGAGVRF